MKKSIPGTPSELKDLENKEKKISYRNIFGWVFQILLWIAILFCFIFKNTRSLGAISFEFFCLIYIIYLIIEFFSETSKFLCNKKKNKGIYEKMVEYFKTPPTITLNCESYHFENKIGNNVGNYLGEEVITYKEDYIFPYYSQRDVSGLFYINCDKTNALKKKYIKLVLDVEVNFADSISYYDYEVQKYNLWKRNRFKDALFLYYESRSIPGFVHHNLITIGDKEPLMVNFYLFAIITILGFSEIYKSYVNSLCVYQKFKIRKLISTRYDLNQPDFEKQYQSLVPRINLIVKHINFNPNEYTYLNNDYEVKIPTEKELEEAKKYENKIPNYQISTGEEGIQAGVIIDNPDYSNYDKSPPKGFEYYSGNTVLSPEIINPNGDVPPEFGKPRPKSKNKSKESNNKENEMNNNRLLPENEDSFLGEKEHINIEEDQKGYIPPSIY